ncbi:MAG: RsmD family RNA methyltransferase [Candidatus Saccharimonadales bacterium]
MTKKPLPLIQVTIDRMIGGGQAIGTLESGKKCLVWGGLPGEAVTVQVTKKKSSFVEGVVTEVIKPSKERITPRDPDSYLSTSPWQIVTLDGEQHYKSALIEEAFELHDIVLPQPITLYSDGREYEYRNKIEFSFWWDKDLDQLGLAFFRRGTHGKIPVESSGLAHPAINQAGKSIIDILRKRPVQAFMLKTVIIRCDRQGNVVAQLYVKDEMFDAFTEDELISLNIQGFELIFSNPKSPASVITKRLQSWGETTLTDTILDVPFTYAVEGFFQINLPVYDQALRDMSKWVAADKPVVDLYSGVGSIGLTIGGDNVTMVEINEYAVREMQRNITAMEREKTAKAILAPSETALEHITSDSTIILDPPRAGLHDDVVNKLLEAAPERIIYLSCNPVTQARDVALLAEKYGIRHHQGYNFFPRTPHIEHLIVLDLK